MNINNEATSIMHFGSVDAYREQINHDPAAIFKEARQATDFDFVLEVRNILINAGASAEQITAYDTAKIIADAQSMRPDAQRHLINRFFRTQMLSLREVDSIVVRTYLIDAGEYSDWIRLFKDSVVPFLIRNSLPKVLF